MKRKEKRGREGRRKDGGGRKIETWKHTCFQDFYAWQEKAFPFSFCLFRKSSYGIGNKRGVAKEGSMLLFSALVCRLTDDMQNNVPKSVPTSRSRDSAHVLSPSTLSNLEKYHFSGAKLILARPAQEYASCQTHLQGAVLPKIRSPFWIFMCAPGLYHRILILGSGMGPTWCHTGAKPHWCQAP